MIFASIKQTMKKKRCIQIFTCRDKSGIQKSLQKQLSYNFIHILLQKYTDINIFPILPKVFCKVFTYFSAFTTPKRKRIFSSIIKLSVSESASWHLNPVSVTTTLHTMCIHIKAVKSFDLISSKVIQNKNKHKSENFKLWVLLLWLPGQSTRLLFPDVFTVSSAAALGFRVMQCKWASESGLKTEDLNFL